MPIRKFSRREPRLDGVSPSPRLRHYRLRQLESLRRVGEMEIVRSELGPNVIVDRVVVALGSMPERHVSISQVMVATV